jgi:hypothetical protein
VFPGFVGAQISAPGASGSDKTNYPVFNETDSIYVFCAQAEGSAIAVLRANTRFGQEQKHFCGKNIILAMPLLNFIFRKVHLNKVLKFRIN